MGDEKIRWWAGRDLNAAYSGDITRYSPLPSFLVENHDFLDHILMLDISLTTTAQARIYTTLLFIFTFINCAGWVR